MRELICKLFGHRWGRERVSKSVVYIKRKRICKYCETTVIRTSLNPERSL
jgi:hypothetical protein